MDFVFLCLDDVLYLMWWSFILQYISRPCNSLNGEKVIYDSSTKVKQQFAQRIMGFYLAKFEKNILFGPFQLYNYHLTAKHKTEKRIVK